MGTVPQRSRILCTQSQSQAQSLAFPLPTLHGCERRGNRRAEEEGGGGERRRRAEEESGRRRRGVRNHFTPTRNVAAQPTPSERAEEQERVRERERTCSSVYAVSIRLELLATATLNVKRRRGAIHFPNHSLHIPDIESNPRAPLPAYAPRVYDGLAVAASPVAARAPDPVPAMTAVHMTPKHFFKYKYIVSKKKQNTAY